MAKALSLTPSWVNRRNARLFPIEYYPFPTYSVRRKFWKNILLVDKITISDWDTFFKTLLMKLFAFTFDSISHDSAMTINLCSRVWRLDSIDHKSTKFITSSSTLFVLCLSTNNILFPNFSSQSVSSFICWRSKNRNSLFRTTDQGLSL